MKLRDFVLLLLRGIQKDEEFHDLTGRTMAQKVIFLITKNGPWRESFGLHYRMHHYGPYSREVTEESENLTTFGLVEEIPKEFPDRTRYDLRLTPTGEKRANELYGALDPVSKRQLERMTTEAMDLNRTVLDQVIQIAYEEAKKEGLY